MSNPIRTYPLRREYLVSYDVEDNAIRGRLFKELQRHGLRPVQKSVFWGYLTQAELQSLNRYLKEHLDETDKAFIVHSNFNGRGQNCFVGHPKEDFKDWEETLVL